MRKHIFTLMALAAALCACNKEQMIESEVTNPETEPSAPLVFTATMEDAPASKATFDNTAKCASWEIGDQVNIDGSIYEAQSSGTTTIFKKSTTPSFKEIRPSFVSSDSRGFSDAEKPSKLVDNLGVETKWCANTTHRSSDVWDIVVSIGNAAKLQAIKLWNGNDTKENSGRRWKNVRVSGASSADGDYIVIKTFENLNLASDNNKLAGTLEVNATQEYSFYKVEILDVMSGDIMQMSDMKFVITQQIIDKHIAYFPASLYNGVAALPAEISETWADGKFNMPMYATSTTTDLAFKNLCGVLKITVKSDQIAAVKNIRVSSATKAVSGTFIVNAKNAAVLPNASTVANTLTITYTEAVPTTAEGKVFYVAVPAQTYQELKIELDPDGKGFTKSMTTKAGTNITVERNMIYPITFANNPPPTTGTAKATINGSDVDVNWVQLWAGGPKFAEKNVGASSYTDGGTTMRFTDAIKEGEEFAWGANWCTPSKGEMDELLKAATSAGSEKVTCTYTEKNGVYGFEFTGRKAGYESNSVFFPAQTVRSDYGDAGYWSGTASGSTGWIMDLYCKDGYWYSRWLELPQYFDCLVRPVLKN